MALDFMRWADRALQTRGQCHETEIFKSYARSSSVAARADASVVRALIRVWAERNGHGATEWARTPGGYLRGMSLAPKPDTASK